MQNDESSSNIPNIDIFFTDAFQRNLRHIAQLQSDRFEHTLASYRELFLLYFQKVVINESITTFHKEFIQKNIENINPKLIQIDELKEMGEEVIKETFQYIIKAYKNWLNLDLTKAANCISDLLKKNQLVSRSFDPLDIGNHMLFRGRISENYLSVLDMYHIPFNKRYLLGNQRYSLVGHPILYLAFSPLGILLELDVFHRLKQNPHNESCIQLMHDLKISSFLLKPTASFNKTIFRMINPYFDKTMSFVHLNMEECKEYIHKKTKSYFSRFILYNCCSFTKKAKLGLNRYGYSLQQMFVEEYVLPQIVAQVLAEKGYGGIIYNSTKVNPLATIQPSNLYNVALFTTFNSEAMNHRDYIYDEDLFYKFNICAPIQYSDYTTFDKLMVELSNIKELAISLTLSDTKYTGFLVELISLFDTQEETYWKTDEGKLHLYFIYQQLLSIEKSI